MTERDPSYRPASETGQATDEFADDGDLADMLGELRILLPSAQLLSAFLITVPFNPGFAGIISSEKKVFLATFILSILSLVLLSARQFSTASFVR